MEREKGKGILILAINECFLKWQRNNKKHNIDSSLSSESEKL